MTGWDVVDHVFARVAPATALATCAACFFAWMFYRSCVKSIESLQSENKRLVEEKKILYTKLGLEVELSGLNHYDKK